MYFVVLVVLLGCFLKKKNILFHHIHGLGWFKQTSFYGLPDWVLKLISPLGFFIEKLEIVLISKFFQGEVLTVSNSSKQELIQHGLSPQRISIISTGLSREPLQSLEISLPKEAHFTILFVGLRKIKRPLEALKAFHIVHKSHPKSKLWIFGWGTEEMELRKYCQKHGLVNYVNFFGTVEEETKWQLMQQAHVLICTSLKEGWGLVVNEANSMGTPVVAYNVSGLRDSVSFGNGFLSNPNPNSMATTLLQVAQMLEERPEEYEELRQKCLAHSQHLTFDRTCQEFGQALLRN